MPPAVREASTTGTSTSSAPPPTVLPVLTFRVERGNRQNTTGPTSVSIRPPAFGGAARRSMRPYTVSVPPHDRVAYASFLVPHEYVQGGFLGAVLELPRKPENPTP